jgi:hypothetical protein
MAGKVFLKIFSVFFSCWFFISLSACVMPVDIQVFKEDPKVGKIIETANKSVKVINLTGDKLIGRSGYIDGLNQDKYYMVEKETDSKDLVVPGYPKYVTDAIVLGESLGPGGLDPYLGYITKIKNGSIKGLNDYHTYTVRSAMPLSGNVTYTDDLGPATKQINDGVLNIEGIKGQGSLNLSSVLSGTNYEVIAVYIDTTTDSPWSWNTQDANLTSFSLLGADKEVDYVFVNKKDLSDFKVLRVKTGPLIVPGSSAFNITLTITDAANGSTVSSTPATPTISRGDFISGSTLTISLSGTWDSVLWSVDGISNTIIDSHVTANKLIITNSQDFWPALAGSSFIVIVRSAIKGGEDYTPADNRFTVTVTD